MMLLTTTYLCTCAMFSNAYGLHHNDTDNDFMLVLLMMLMLVSLGCWLDSAWLAAYNFMLISSKVGLLPFINAQFPHSSAMVVDCNFLCVLVCMRAWILLCVCVRPLHVIALRLTHFSTFILPHRKYETSRFSIFISVFLGVNRFRCN